MRSLLRLIRYSPVTALVGGLVALVTTVAPAASASAATSAPAATGADWVRCAHLSPNTPAVDVYMYAFGSTANPVILRHVSYGNVSGYMPVKAGQYTVAMRAAGASASSSPVLSTSFSVTDVLASKLAFGSATGYQPLAPGSGTVKFTSGVRSGAAQ